MNQATKELVEQRAQELWANRAERDDVSEVLRKRDFPQNEIDYFDWDQLLEPIRNEIREIARREVP